MREVAHDAAQLAAHDVLAGLDGPVEMRLHILERGTQRVRPLLEGSQRFFLLVDLLLQGRDLGAFGREQCLHLLELRADAGLVGPNQLQQAAGDLLQQHGNGAVAHHVSYRVGDLSHAGRERRRRLPGQPGELRLGAHGMGR
jgi:hypothetical protein